MTNLCVLILRELYANQLPHLAFAQQPTGEIFLPSFMHDDPCFVVSLCLFALTRQQLNQPLRSLRSQDDRRLHTLLPVLLLVKCRLN